ncbi:mRNA-degrading endonuclease YafQ of YafQ-DinJ toxin-antitoxin module [Actinopolyspora lacussalsi]|nr:mRNA-degrading endonuclease YafQ of YafQ-DinJ toxin-antitoxin module [Actinopolyspora lacussalsi]
MTAAEVPRTDLEVPLLSLRHAGRPERPAHVPPNLDNDELRALITAAHPELEQIHRPHPTHGETVHGYRDRRTGDWVIVFERAEKRSTLKEYGGPLWDRIVALVSRWQATSRSTSHHSRQG